MILKQLIDNINPIAYWTGESYTTGNVFDEYATWTLVNTNASLGVQGGSSPSLSSRAINVNGGYLRISDGSFLNSQIAIRDFSIGFGLRVYNRTKDNPISGFKPIISKWNPEQSFMIGFENGIIVAKVQTSGGLVEVEFDYPDIIYNDRWNYVQLNVTASTITLWVNGCPVSVSDASNIITTSASFFQIGGNGVETFGEDVYVADISVTESITDEFSRMLYTFPRTPHSVMLDFNPTHYFNLLDSPQPDAPHVNLGSAGGYGYIVYSGDAPTKVKFTAYMDEDVINFPEGSKLVVDTIPDIDLTGGFSMVVRGWVSSTGMTNSATAAHDVRILEARNSLDNNNGRFLFSYNWRSSGSNNFIGWQGYDATGTQVSSDSGYNDDANNHFNICSNVYKFKSGDIQFSTSRYYDRTETGDTTYALGYDLPLTINYLDLWSNVATDSIRASMISLFGYELPDEVSAIINPPKFRMISQHILDKYSSELVWLLWGIGGNITYSVGSSFDHPLTGTNGYSYVSSSYDPAQNRQNDFPRTISLPAVENYIGGGTNDDNIDLGGSGGMTIYAFVWNRNLQDRYRWIYGTSGIDLEIWMNSRDGVLSYGDVEVMLDKDIADSHLSTTTRDFTDNGFVFFAVTRDGNELSIWINGEVVASKILASVPSFDTSNNTLRMHGGPLYVNDWGVFMAPLDATDLALTSYGLQDYISGQCTLNTVELPSVLLATDSHDGRVMKTNTTDNDGNFKFFLPKSLDGKAVTVLALAQDDNATNNVVAHGPYNLQTDYRKYSFEQTTQDYDDMVLDFEPYAYYKMDETSGTTIADSSGNGRDGTANGGLTLNQDGPSSFLKAIVFDGTDDHIDLPAGYDDLSEGFTYEGWVRYDAFNNNSRLIDLSTTQGNGDNAIVIANTTTGNLQVRTLNGSSDIHNINISSFFPTGSWIHIVIRVDINGNLSWWKNGIKIGQVSGSALPNISRTVNWIARTGWGAGDGYFQGAMSNIVTYDHALPDEEIERHSARGYEIPVQTLKSLITRANPYAYWTFDRLDQYTNQTDESIAPLTQNGSFSIVKNALAINTGVVGNNYLTTDGVSLDDNGDGWTVEFSFKTGSTQVLAILLAEWNTGGGNVGTFKAQLNNSNLLSVHLNDDSTQIVSTTTYNDDEWHHVVIANDGNGTTRLYVDGSEEDSISTAINYGGNEFSIGNSADGDTSTATEAATYLDDVAIYKYGLNATRITEHYNQFVKKKVYQ